MRIVTLKTSPLPSSNITKHARFFSTTKQLLHIATTSWLTQFSKEAADYSSKSSSVNYDLRIRDPLQWSRKRFEWNQDFWDPVRMPDSLKRRLCVGDPMKEYTEIGEVFSFPDAEENPVINNPSHPCKIYWDHNSETEKILIQLSSSVPPLLWIGVKPTVESIKKIFAEFLDVDTEHMKAHLPEYEERQQNIEKMYGSEIHNTKEMNPHRIKEHFRTEMRKKDPATFRLDWTSNHQLFLGNFENFHIVERRFMDQNPFVFGWPLLMGEGNTFLEDTPVRAAAFRTTLSKSILLLQGRFDLQLSARQRGIPSARDQDTASWEQADKDPPLEEELILEIPTFVTINYKPNTRLCGGRALVERYNSVMGTDYPCDTPIDVLCALSKEELIKSTKQIREEITLLSRVLETGVERERHPRLPEILHTSTKVVGQLAYAIAYLACMEDEMWEGDIYQRFYDHPHNMIRLACVKGAKIMSRLDLIEKSIQNEQEADTLITMKKLSDDAH